MSKTNKISNTIKISNDEKDPKDKKIIKDIILKYNVNKISKTNK